MAADAQLARPAGRNRCAVLVEDMDGRAGDRFADGGQRAVEAARRHDAGGRDDGAFRRAIIIDDRERQLGPREDMQRVAAGQQEAQRRRRGPIHGDQQFGERRRHEADR